MASDRRSKSRDSKRVAHPDAVLVLFAAIQAIVPLLNQASDWFATPLWTNITLACSATLTAIAAIVVRRVSDVRAVKRERIRSLTDTLVLAQGDDGAFPRSPT